MITLVLARKGRCVVFRVCANFISAPSPFVLKLSYHNCVVCQEVIGVFYELFFKYTMNSEIFFLFLQKVTFSSIQTVHTVFFCILPAFISQNGAFAFICQGRRLFWNISRLCVFCRMNRQVMLCLFSCQNIYGFPKDYFFAAFLAQLEPSSGWFGQKFSL